MNAATIATVTIPAVVGICAIVNYCIKSFVHNDRVHDFIPTVSCILGAILVTVNAFAMAEPYSLETLFEGMASGLAATGGYELITHLKETKVDGEHISE